MLCKKRLSCLVLYGEQQMEENLWIMKENKRLLQSSSENDEAT